MKLSLNFPFDISLSTNRYLTIDYPPLQPTSLIVLVVVQVIVVRVAVIVIVVAVAVVFPS